MNISRRHFLRQSSAGTLGLLGTQASGCAFLFRNDGGGRWHDVPPLDGVLDMREITREQMGRDLGGHFHRVPAAVLQPGSVDDIAKIVRFARTRGLTVAMRGRGHAPYGQSLAEGGFVVDSRTLDRVLGVSTTADVQAGASWEEVTRATLLQGLTPPVMGDTMTLSVGGILSAGGVGNSSHLHGLVVDNVEELDLVTGTGDLVGCSAERSPELFELALAGMGQCALITGARLRLVRAPKAVARRDLDYDSLQTFVADHRRLAAEGAFEHLGAYVIARESGGFQFRINVGKFCERPEQVDWAVLLSGLGFQTRGEPHPLGFADYLHRENARNAAAEARWRLMPLRFLHLTMLIPQARAASFLANLLANPADTAGMTRLSLYWLPARKLTRPMFARPEGDWVLTIFLFREVPVADQSRYVELESAVRDLAARTREVGGKCYSPHAPFYTRADWEAHYGKELWVRLTSAKRRLDPAGILTPGVGVSLAAVSARLSGWSSTAGRSSTR